MKKFFKCAITALAFCAFCQNPFADLVWTKDKGWQIQGGVLAKVMGENTNVENALQGMNLAKKAQNEESYGQALALYQVVVSDYPNSIFAPEAYCQMGIIYTKRHQWELANECFQTIIQKYPDYPNFNQIIGRQYEVASLIQSGEHPYLWGWFPWFLNYKDAIKIYEDVISNAPYSEYAPMALMNISLCAQSNGEPETSIDALDRLINVYPKSDLVPDAYLQLAKTYRNMVEGPHYDQTPTKEAIAFYQDYIILFPNEKDSVHAENGLYVMQDTLARSRLIMGDFYYFYRTDNTAAAVFYNEAITLAPKSPAADLAREQLKLIAEGEIAPMTPVDWVFGRYEKPAVDTFEDETKVEKMQTEKFSEIQDEVFEAEAKAFDKNESNKKAPVEFVPLLPETNEEGFVDQP